MCELLLLGRDLCERKLKEGCSGLISPHDGIHVIFPKAFRTTEQYRSGPFCGDLGLRRYPARYYSPPAGCPGDSGCLAASFCSCTPDCCTRFRSLGCSCPFSSRMMP